MQEVVASRRAPPIAAVTYGHIIYVYPKKGSFKLRGVFVAKSAKRKKLFVVVLVVLLGDCLTDFQCRFQ